jgi:hypothetical protein
LTDTKRSQNKVIKTKSSDLSEQQKSLEILNKRKIALEAEKAAVENLAKKREALAKAEAAHA